MNQYELPIFGILNEEVDVASAEELKSNLEDIVFRDVEIDARLIAAVIPAVASVSVPRTLRDERITSAFTAKDAECGAVMPEEKALLIRSDTCLLSRVARAGCE